MSQPSNLPLPGTPVAELLTPALVIDLDAMTRNLQRMAGYARQHGLRLRPHAKMHKSAHIAGLQRAAGAVGVCVQKLSEAEALAHPASGEGVQDIYISNQILSPAKLARVAALAQQVKLAIAVDSALGVQRLADAMRNVSGIGAQIDVFVEVDVGQGRCGVAPAAAGALAHQVVAHEAQGLRFAGLQAYHGGAQHLRSPQEREAAIQHAASRARAAQAAITAAGIACPLVTGAGSGTFTCEASHALWGELQCGSYLFMDADYAANTATPGAPVFEHALFVKSQVISRSLAHAVVDAGHKTHAIDCGMPTVWQQPALTVGNGGDEHGLLHPAPGASPDVLPQLGETVWLVPNHCDPTVNLHDHYIAVRGGLQDGVVDAVWKVDARGCVV